MVKSLQVRHLQKRRAKLPVTVDASSLSEDLRFCGGRWAVAVDGVRERKFVYFLHRIHCVHPLFALRYKGLAHSLTFPLARARQLADCPHTLFPLLDIMA